MSFKFDLANPKYEYVVDAAGLNAALEVLEKEKVVGVDIEATSLDPFTGLLILVQIATSEVSYLFDARLIKLTEFPRFKEFLENPKIIKIFHNGKFDYKYIKVNLGISTANIFDTMLSEIILNAGIGRPYNSLAFLAKKYLELTLEKETRDSFITVTNKTKLNPAQLKYAALDTLVVFPIFEKQLTLLKKEGLVNIAKLEFAVTRVVGEMEITGLHVDEKKWREIISRLTTKRNELAKQFQQDIAPYFKRSTLDLFGNTADYININSQVQLMDLFNNKLGLNLPSTNDSILSGTSHPIVKLLRDYRTYGKLVSAFGDSLLSKIHPKTHRLHPEFNQLGAATGRFSCINPNLQQIPRYSAEVPFRECFNPRPGYKLVVADYSSIEMRILADFSGDEKMVKALNDGLDIHSYTASLMFNLRYTDNFKKEYPHYRQIAKPIGFGLMYGMGPSGLARSLEMETGEPVTKEQGAEYMDKYFQSYPSVKAYLDRSAKAAVRNGWSATPGGRKRWYNKPDKDSPDYKREIAQIEREAKNHPIQGTSADSTKYALVFVHDRFKKEGVDGAITHTIHDEIVTEVREDQAEGWAKIQAEEMVRAAKLFIKKVNVKVDTFVGDVWEH